MVHNCKNAALDATNIRDGKAEQNDGRISSMNENMSCFLADLDDLQYRMECGIGLFDAVRECMTGRSDGGKEYQDALFGAPS